MVSGWWLRLWVSEVGVHSGDVGMELSAPPLALPYRCYRGLTWRDISVFPKIPISLAAAFSLEMIPGPSLQDPHIWMQLLVLYYVLLIGPINSRNSI